MIDIQVNKYQCHHTRPDKIRYTVPLARDTSGTDNDLASGKERRPSLSRTRSRSLNAKNSVSKILYVEDNPQNMRLVRKILKHAGYEVIEAEDGLSGIQMATDEQPDLILMDVNLPDIDGLEATQRLRKLPAFATTPIIALTANAMVGDREKALEAGCDAYLPKPISKTELLKAVSEHLKENTPN